MSYQHIQEIPTGHTPESLAEQLAGEPGLLLLRSASFDSPQARYSLVAARPLLTFRSFGSRCELSGAGWHRVQFGDPWRVLDGLLGRFEMRDAVDLPFPLGGVFGYWGYELKDFVEPKLRRRASDELELPSCHVGFYASLALFDHQLGKTWCIATGLDRDGSRSPERARAQMDFWEARLGHTAPTDGRSVASWSRGPSTSTRSSPSNHQVVSNVTREEFLARVARARAYIRAGDIYQVNLSQRLMAPQAPPAWDLYASLTAVSPAPFSAYLDCGDFQLVSSSPELFLRLSGEQVETRPIKGTRPRSPDATRDAQLAYELQTSAKENAELVMITDLLRNDLGKVCQFGSVHTPELARLERYAHVQHLVSAVTGRLRPELTHLAALASCFPGGSITGAPKFRAMEIIDELETARRGPFTGALGYLGFNRESQLSIIIRTAICKDGAAYFPVGAGIVADSDPAAEFEETLAKARGFIEALEWRRSQPNLEEHNLQTRRPLSPGRRP